MKKLLLATLLIFSTSSLFAKDSKKTMTKEEFMKQFMKLEEREKHAVATIKSEQAKTQELEKEAQEQRLRTQRLEKEAQRQRLQTQELEKIVQALENAKKQKTTKK